MLVENEELKTQVTQFEETLHGLNQGRHENGRLVAARELELKQQEEEIEKQMATIEEMEERLASAQNDRTQFKEQMEHQSSELEAFESTLSTAQSEKAEMVQELDRQSWVIKDLEARLSSARSDQDNMPQEIETHLSEIRRLKSDLSTAQDNQTKLTEENKKLCELHESVRQSEKGQSVVINHLKQRLEAENSKSVSLQADCDALTQEVERINALVGNLETERLENKQEMDRLTNQVEFLEKHKKGLEEAMEERDGAREGELQAQLPIEDLGKDVFSASSEQEKMLQPDITELSTSPQQVGTSEVVSDGSWVSVVAPDVTAEHAASVIAPVSISGAEPPNREQKTDSGTADVKEDESSAADHPATPVAGTTGKLATRANWADADEQEGGFLDTEMKKFTAGTASFPSATSPTSSPAQDNSTAEPQPSIDDGESKSEPVATAPSSNATSPPTTLSSPPGQGIDYCMHCKKDVPVEKFRSRDGIETTNWRKHLGETKCAPRSRKTPAGLQSSGGSAPTSPALYSPDGHQSFGDNSIRAGFGGFGGFGGLGGRGSGGGGGGGGSAPSSPRGYRGNYDNSNRGGHRGGGSGRGSRPSSPADHSSRGGFSRGSRGGGSWRTPDNADDA
jgi:hypothetical protein